MGLRQALACRYAQAVLMPAAARVPLVWTVVHWQGEGRGRPPLYLSSPSYFFPPPFLAFFASASSRSRSSCCRTPSLPLQASMDAENSGMAERTA
jgi:hypothetical protein